MNGDDLVDLGASLVLILILLLVAAAVNSAWS